MIPGPPENGGVGLASIEPWCGLHQEATGTWHLRLSAVIGSACHVIACFKFCDGRKRYFFSPNLEDGMPY